jgi:hypothetical protein
MALVQKYTIFLIIACISRKLAMENIWGDGITGAPNLPARSGLLGGDTSPARSAREEEEDDPAATGVDETGVDETCLDKDDSMDVSGDESNDKDSSVGLTDPTAGNKSLPDPGEGGESVSGGGGG